MKKDSSYLKSPDLLPINLQKREISTRGFSFMWIGMCIVLAAFAVGGGGVGQLSLFTVLLAAIIGCVAIGLVITVIGDIGIEHGLSFPVYMRAPFGTVGTHIPSIVRGVTASMWFGINTFFGAAAINGIFNVLFGFDNWFVCYILFALVQLINTAIGIKSIEQFANLAAPIIIIISIWLYFTMSSTAASEGKNVWTWVEMPAFGMDAFNAFLVVIFSVMGFWATLGADIPSLSRFIKAPRGERNWWKRNKGCGVGSLIFMPLTLTFMVAIGGVAYIAVGTYDPVESLSQTSEGFVLVVLLLMIVFAQWSTNTAANVVPAATIFSNVGGPKVPFWVGVFIAGIIGLISQPWNLFAVIIPFLLVTGGILSAVIGILFVDYYILRKRRVNVPDLYKNDGQYRYAGGVNWAGMISWIIGGTASIIFTNYSFVAGSISAGIIYYFLAKYWYFQKYKQAEIEDPDDQKYLGITAGRDWHIGEDGSESVPVGHEESFSS